MPEYLISALIIVPFLGCVITAFSGRWARWVSLLTTLVVSGILAMAWSEGLLSGAAHDAVMSWTEFAPSWALRIDGLSVPLVLLTAFLGFVAVLASWGIDDKPGAHHAMLLLLQAAVTGVFLADDILLFYVFWEAVLIPMYFLIGVWGHERRRHAAAKFFIYTFLASVLMLLGILLVVFVVGETRISVLSQVVMWAPEVYPEVNLTLIFWLLTIGMLVKVPVVPLHTWLPDAHVEAPTAGSIMLAGVLLKMGGYGLLRIAIPFAPEIAQKSAWILATLGIIGIVYGAAMALAQVDLKRLVAYSSVAHMGFVVLAIATGTPAGYSAALLGMISHGVVSALLFFLVGALYDRTHTRQLADFGGFGDVIPAWAAVFTFGALASLGLPGLSGFPGEFLAMMEAFSAFGWWIAVATLGVVLGAAYNLRAVWAVNHREASDRWTHISDLTAREWIPVSLLVTAIVVLGVWPRLVTDVSNAVLALISSGGF